VNCRAHYCLLLAEKILDQVPGLKEPRSEALLCFPIACWWNYSAFPISLELVNDPFMCIEGFVGNQGIGSDLSQQNLSALQIMS
jgi:hypothetical protein